MYRHAGKLLNHLAGDAKKRMSEHWVTLKLAKQVLRSSILKTRWMICVAGLTGVVICAM
jgi:hypothetical protein